MTFPDRQQFSFNLYLLGLIVLIASLPLSKFGMSIAQIGIAISWVLGGDYKNKFKIFFSSRIALLLSSVFLLHLIGLLWTTDFEYAFKDIRIKAPLLLMPFLLVTSPRLNKFQFDILLYALIGGVLASTLISMAVWLGFTGKEITNIRDISIFISHIRLVLICCIAIFAAVWLITHNKSVKSDLYSVVLIAVILWLTFFVFFIQGLTGMIVIATASVAAMGLLILHSRQSVRKTLYLVILVFPAVFVFMNFNSVMRTIKPKKELLSQNHEKLTASGRTYQHQTDRQEFENGYPLWIYVCEEELRREWNRRSEINYDGRDKLDHEMRMTLIRFLTSKGQRKDSAGVWSLNENEIAAIENGTANIFYLNKADPRARLHQVMWEIENYRMGGDPSGHSVAQRLEYWKAAAGIINEHPLFGVGTGDVPAAFKEQYLKMNSRLSEKWRLRSHNQYLSMAVAFGITGLCWFMFTLIAALVIAFRQRNYLYLFFALAAIISMVTEDTLETQAGLTFFALFSSLFLFVYPQKTAIDGNPGDLPSR